MIEISDTIKKLAKKYKVKVKRETTYCNRNTGASIRNEIFLGEFDNEEIEILVFFHELAHIKDNLIMKNRDNYFCIMSKEGLAWELGITLASENGYSWDYYSPVLKWAREEYKTYNKHENFN